MCFLVKFFQTKDERQPNKKTSYGGGVIMPKTCTCKKYQPISTSGFIDL